MQHAIEEHNCRERMCDAVGKSAFSLKVSDGDGNGIQLPQVEWDGGHAQDGCEQNTVVFVVVDMKEKGSFMMPVG